ncbi:MAG: histidine phosphatase family protein [Candidatus Levyibacteriota bacterium]
MAKLYIFRHGQTTDNLSHTFSGKRDVDLTPGGEEEAKRIGKELSNIIPTIAYQSEQLRSKRTLDLVLEGKKEGLKIIEDKRIRERDYGDLTGKNKDEIAKKFPDKYPLWHRSYDTPPPNGESIKDVSDRVLSFLKDELPKWEEEDVIFISASGNSIRPMRMYFEKLTPKEACFYENIRGKVYSYDI